MPSRGVERAPGDRLAPGMAIVTRKSRAPPGTHLGEGGRGSSRAVPGLMAGSPTARGRPGRVTVPTPSPAAKRSAATQAARRTLDLDDGAMSDVRVIAGVLDDRGHRLALALLMAREREGRGLALGESDRDGVRKAARDEGRAGCLRGGRGAGARRPPVAQGSRRFFQVRHRPDRSLHTHRISIKTVYQTSGNQWIDGQHAYRLGTRFPGLPLR